MDDDYDRGGSGCLVVAALFLLVVWGCEKFETSGKKLESIDKRLANIESGFDKK
jgi:hypothetical protein